MLSHSLHCALEREVIGQRRAVETVVRSVTVALGGLADDDGPLGVYLFVGPRGTGKSHLARSLARTLHGDLERLTVVDCNQLAGGDAWPWLMVQLAPHFHLDAESPEAVVATAEPLSILMFDHLEAARPEFVQALVAGLKSGWLPLPEGKRGSLRGCLVLLSSKLCAREVYEAERKEIGFSSASEDLDSSEKARIYQLCCSAVEKQWGADLVGDLDDLIVFHRLREDHLPAILKRLLDELNDQLAERQVSCELAPSAAGFILDRGARFLHHGALALLKNFRRFVRFPMSDMIHGNGIPQGSRVLVELAADERLRFTVTMVASAEPDAPEEVPIDWQEESPEIVEAEALSRRHAARR